MEHSLQDIPLSHKQEQRCWRDESSEKLSGCVRGVSLSSMTTFEMCCDSKDLEAAGMTVSDGIHKDTLGLPEEKD